MEDIQETPCVLRELYANEYTVRPQWGETGYCVEVQCYWPLTPDAAYLLAEAVNVCAKSCERANRRERASRRKGK